jgi:hypothetical protein
MTRFPDHPLLAGISVIPEFDTDAHTVVLRHRKPGPAGVTILEVNDISVTFDVASPGLLCQLIIEDIDTPEALMQRADQLAPFIDQAHIPDLIAALSASRSSKVTFGATPPPTSRQSPQGVVFQWAHVAASVDAEHRLGLLPQERLVQRLESALLAAAIGLPQSALGDDESLSDRLQQLLQLPPSELARLDARSGGRLQAMLTRSELAECASELAETASRVATDLVRANHNREVEPPEPPALISDLPREKCNSVNLLAGGPPLDIECLTGDEYVVSLEGFGARSAGWWVRCFLENQNVPIAVVPLRRTESGDAEARLLLPRNLEDDIAWEVVETPVGAHRSPTFRVFERAISSAVSATRLERCSSEAAAAYWEDAAQHHLAAGDTTRSQQSLACAATPPTRPASTPSPIPESTRLGTSPVANRQVLPVLVSDLLGPTFVTPPPSDLPPTPR